MDEPFAALDAQTRELMQAELLQIWAEARKTVLFITHQIDEAIYLADRVGRVLRPAGPGEEIIGVEIERPRRLGVKREARFHAIEDRIWGLIEEDVKGRLAAECARRHRKRSDSEFLTEQRQQSDDIQTTRRSHATAHIYSGSWSARHAPAHFLCAVARRGADIASRSASRPRS